MKTMSVVQIAETRIVHYQNLSVMTDVVIIGPHQETIETVALKTMNAAINQCAMIEGVILAPQD